MNVTIKAKNFLSWENLEFNTTDGVTLIQGYNFDDDTPEGCGKSAILNALSWGIYGKIPKDANIDDVIKTGQKSCAVQIGIGADFIVRARKPNDLYILKFDGEGHKNVKGKDAKETQKLIEELVGLSFDTFLQSIYFAQNYNKRFITATQEEKGKIISEIQNLEIFDKARKESHEMIKLEKTKIEKLENQLREIQLKLDHADQTIQMIEKHKQQKLEESENRINTLKLKKLDILTKIDENSDNLNNKQEIINNNINENKLKNTEHTNNLASINQKILDYDKTAIESTISQLQVDKATIKAQLSTITQAQSILQNYILEINRLEKSKTIPYSKIQKLVDFIKDPINKCPTCGTILETKDTSHAELELLELENEITQIQNQIEEITSKKDAHVIPDASEINNAIAEIELLINSENSKLKNLKDLEQNKLDLENKMVMLENTVKQLKLDATAQHDLFNQRAAQLQTDLNQIEFEISNQSDIDTSEFDLEISKQNQAKELINNQKSDIKLLKLEAETYINRLDTLKSGFREIKTYIFNTVLNELMYKSNKYLEELFEVSAKIKFSTEDMKINTEVTLDGETRPLGLLSGGQSRRFYLAVDLALSEIVLSRKGSKLNLRVLDEYFKDLSESSMNKCLTLLEKLEGSTLLIEHNSLFKSIVDKTFEIEYKDKTSRSI